MSYATGDSLLVRIRLAFGASIAADPATWVWTDVTPYWHVPDEVSIGWGRTSGADQAETSTLALTLKNTDSRFTAYDPRSPYWPHVKKWTPIQYDIDLSDGVGWRNRFSGFVRKWPLTWPGRSPFMALAKIEAVGVLGRLGRGKPPVRSALRRNIAASGALAYWPAEDGSVSTQVASAVPGVPALAITGDGVVKFVPVDQLNISGSGASAARYGTQAMLDLAAGGSLVGTIPASVTAATQSAWTVHALARVSLTLADGDVVLMEWDTPGGTHTRWKLLFNQATFHIQVIAYDASGTPTVVIDEGSVTTSFTPWDVSAWQSGGNINVGLRINTFTGAYRLTGSVAGTLAGITGIRINPTGAALSSDEMPVGHIAIWDVTPMPYQGINPTIDAYTVVVDGPVFAYYMEAAHVRLARLCAEDGVPISVAPVGDAGLVTRMDRQLLASTQLDLYRECETADQGLIYESGFGLGYVPRPDRYNPPVALTIDAAAGQLSMPFEPVDDDQTLRNRWTVERAGGSSAVAVDQASIDAQGEIEASVTVSLAADDVLPDHAAWRLHQSTVPEPRYPAVSINLGAHPELAAAWCGVKPGSRIQVVNPPEQNTPGTVDQLVVGGAETYRGRRSWRATLNVVPAGPWNVAEVDGVQRVAADGSTLAAILGVGVMSFSLASTAANGPWTIDPADFPLDVRVGGERITLSAITGTTSPQTATVSARTIARGWPAGTEVDVWEPAIVAL